MIGMPDQGRCGSASTCVRHESVLNLNHFWEGEPLTGSGTGDSLTCERADVLIFRNSASLMSPLRSISSRFRNPSWGDGRSWVVQSRNLPNTQNAPTITTSRTIIARPACTAGAVKISGIIVRAKRYGTKAKLRWGWTDGIPSCGTPS